MDEVTAARNADLSNQISVLVAKKAMDTDKEQGQAMVDMIRQSVPPPPNQAGQGHVDMYA